MGSFAAITLVPLAFLALVLALSMTTTMCDYYRADGVRITHDPYAAGMAEKYGSPGATDSEGFDPYADSVGPGIYGGRVQRDQHGQIVIGRQYQNHNPRPGPIYAGGGYTPMSKALGNDKQLAALLDKYPDLVNDISTGGAQPLHNCGMSRTNQMSTAFLVSRGADIEALDTYGYTPLHRMASNNLAVGAQALLDAGADPNYEGDAEHTAMEVAERSGAREVMRVLREHVKRRPMVIKKIVVAGAGEEEVNAEYVVMKASTVPAGFDKVCRQQGWDTNTTWQKLGGSHQWYKAPNGAYIYWNLMDRCWWIDKPNGDGAYKATAPMHAPPQTGWKLLGDYGPPPALVATYRAVY